VTSGPDAVTPSHDPERGADRWGVLALLAVLAVGLGALGANLLDDGVQEPRVVEGIAMPNSSGAAISLHDDVDGEAGEGGEGYIIAGASWAGPDNVWNDGTQVSCVGNDPTVGTRVELGLVEFSDPIVGRGERVVWLRCLG
jgi:hypothetical protein